jgi:hypothetical protein
MTKTEKKKNSIDININVNKSNTKEETDNGEETTIDNLSVEETPEVKTELKKDKTSPEEGVVMEDLKSNAQVSQKSDVLAQQLDRLTSRLDNLESENEGLKKQILLKESQIKELQINSSKLQNEVVKSGYQMFKDKHLTQGNIVEDQLMRDESDGVEKLETLYQSLNDTQRSLLEDFISRSPLKVALQLAEKRSTVVEKDKDLSSSLSKSDWISSRVDSLMEETARTQHLTVNDIMNNDSMYFSLLNQATQEWSDKHSSSF